MAVRIGSIELTGLQHIRTQDARNLVQQRGPGQAGSVAQDLGREPVVIVLEGLLLGDDPRAALEELRQAQTDARPLAFAADAIAGAELTDVLIEDLQVRQLAGYRERYRFYLCVREYTEPPEESAGILGGVADDVDDESGSWLDDAVAAVGLLEDPDSLVSAASSRPGLFAHLGVSQICGVLQAAAPNLGGNGFAGVLRAVGSVDPRKFASVLTDLSGASNFGDFVTKLADDAVDLLDELKDIDLGAAVNLVKALAGGTDFLIKLQDVARRAAELGEVVLTFDPSLGAAGLARTTGSTARDVVSRVDELLLAVDALFKTDTVKALGDLARQLGIGGPLAAGFGGVIAALQQVDGWLTELEGPLDTLNGVATTVRDLVEGLTRLGKTFANPALGSGGAASKALGVAGTVATTLRHVTDGLPRYAEEVMPVRSALGGLISTARGLQAQIGGSP
jgi:hypothetical protein